MRRSLLVLLVAGCFSKPDRPELAADAAPEIDAAPDLCVDADCTIAGGTCVDGTCVITRITSTAVVCPAGMPCRVRCNVKDACKAGVFCGDATACDVQCEAESACVDKGVDCGTATTCNVRCVGQDACHHGDPTAVRCNASTCDVTCSGTAACADGVGAWSDGTCTSHCCNGACSDGTVGCANDAVCL